MTGGLRTEREWQGEYRQTDRSSITECRQRQNVKLLPFFPPTTDHEMMADGTVDSGFGVTRFHIARLVSETCLVWCGIPHVIHLCLN